MDYVHRLHLYSNYNVSMARDTTLYNKNPLPKLTFNIVMSNRVVLVDDAVIVKIFRSSLDHFYVCFAVYALLTDAKLIPAVQNLHLMV